MKGLVRCLMEVFVGGRWGDTPHSPTKISSKTQRQSSPISEKTLKCRYPQMPTIHLLVVLVLHNLLFIPLCVSQSGGKFPYKITENSKYRTYVLTNATIYADYKTVVKSGSVVVRDGKIVYVGEKPPLLPNAIIIDCYGKNIFPAFVDVMSAYGVPDTLFKGGKGEGPMYESVNRGAWSWNMSAHPEINAYNRFKNEAKKADEYRKMGIGAVNIHIPDGVFRGYSALVFLDERNPENALLRDKSGFYLSLHKGSSPQEYPTSVMGAIALIRQHIYDAMFYGKKSQTTENTSLNAIYSSIKSGVPWFFVSRNIIESRAFLRIKNEFNIPRFVIVGAGDEYKWPSLFKGLYVVVPLTFPKPYDVGERYDYDAIPLMALKHWEMAPANPIILHNNGARVVFTTYGIKEMKDLSYAMHRLKAYGFPDSLILKSLTWNPAEIFGLEKALSVIQPGNNAFFVVSEGMPWDSSFVVREVWIGTTRYIYHDLLQPELRGKWITSIKSDTDTAVFEFSEFPDKIKGKVVLPDKRTSEIKIIPSPCCVYNISFEVGDTSHDQKSVKYHAELHLLSDTSGYIQINTGREVIVRPFKKIERFYPSSTTHKRVDYGKVWYPFSPYGFEEPLNISASQKRYLLKGGRVWLFNPDTIIDDLDILIDKGKIQKIGRNLDDKSAIVIDCRGKNITPGIIDEHSHIAIYGGVNEYGDAISSEVRIRDVINNEDVSIFRSLSGGVTIAHLLHGSANPIGGQNAVIKLRWGVPPDSMLYDRAPGTIKFALGENVKQSNWGDKYTIRYPQTRMGVREIIRDAFINAREYMKRKDGYRDLRMEPLAEILKGERYITCHSYVQSEILMLMELADELGFKVNTFTHILEGYKVAPQMRRHGASASTFSDWWAYKFEVYEAIPYNPYLMWMNGVNVGINSDDAEMQRRLNQEASKSIKYGGMSPIEALKMVTLNPAKMLHIDKFTGSIKEGYDADIVVWSGDPLSQYAIVEKTFVDGMLMFDRSILDSIYTRNKKEKERIIRVMMEEISRGVPSQKIPQSFEERYSCTDFD